jgi:hypothetical protein
MRNPIRSTEQGLVLEMTLELFTGLKGSEHPDFFRSPFGNRRNRIGQLRHTASDVPRR